MRHLQTVNSCVSYRAHRNLLHMPSNTFYQGRLKAGRPDRDFNTNLAQRVKVMLKSHFTGIDRLLRDDERQFFLAAKLQDDGCQSWTSFECLQAVLKMAKLLVLVAKVPRSAIGKRAVLPEQATKLEPAGALSHCVENTTKVSSDRGAGAHHKPGDLYKTCRVREFEQQSASHVNLGLRQPRLSLSRTDPHK